ncbi:MAG: barstar family protein [Betaproteobacteria bacterium]|nr:barstar family protein [Betaproteobacteria bacterium]
MCKQDNFVLRVLAGIRSKAELLAALASAGHFPGCFGGNWDALQDCLLDLSWISNRKVLVVHSDLPLPGNPAGFPGA